MWTEQCTKFKDHFRAMVGSIPAFDISDEFNSEWLRTPEAVTQEASDWETVGSGDSGNAETPGTGTAS